MSNYFRNERRVRNKCLLTTGLTIALECLRNKRDLPAKSAMAIPLATDSLAASRVTDEAGIHYIRYPTCCQLIAHPAEPEAAEEGRRGEVPAHWVSPVGNQNRLFVL